MQAQFVAGLRVTDLDSIQIVDEVLNTVINRDIVAGINSLGGKAVQVAGQTVFQAHKSPPIQHEGQSVDLGFVGEGWLFDRACQCLGGGGKGAGGFSIQGRDAQGQIYNVNADIAAAELAIALQAEKIIYLSDVNGILRDFKDASTRIPTVSIKEVFELKGSGVVAGE